MGELVDQVEDAVLPPFVRAIFEEVVGPDMVGSLGAQSGEFIAGCREFPTCRQVERDDSHPLGVNLRAKLEPVRLCQPRQTVHLFAKSTSPGFESLSNRKSSGRASFAPLSFSRYVPTISRPGSAANA